MNHLQWAECEPPDCILSNFRASKRNINTIKVVVVVNSNTFPSLIFKWLTVSKSPKPLLWGTTERISTVYCWGQTKSFVWWSLCRSRWSESLEMLFTCRHDGLHGTWLNIMMFQEGGTTQANKLHLQCCTLVFFLWWHSSSLMLNANSTCSQGCYFCPKCFFSHFKSFNGIKTAQQ